MQLTTYLRALRKNWWIILLLMIIGVAAGVLRNAQATPVYATTTTFYVSTPGANTSQSQFADQQFAEARANSYPQVLSSDRLARLIIERTGLDLTPRDLAGRISGSVELNTITVTATVQDTSKARALRIARAVAVEFPELVDTLDNRGQTPKSVVIDVLSGPERPGQISPRENLNLALGLAAGLLLGLIIAALRELLDTNVRTVGVAEEVVGKPALGTVPFDSATTDSPLIIGEQASTSRAEAMRQIRTNLQFVDVDNPPRVIVVTSSTAVEGKSTTATNLALAFAETDSRVVLIEGDLRRPKVTDYTGIERTVGLSNVLAGQVDLDDVLQPFGESLQVLPSGPTPPNAAAMVGSARMAALVAELRDRFDVVIIDTPPMLPVTDAALLSTLADGVLVVLRHGKVTRVQLATACRSLEAVNAPVVGFVLNMIPKRQAREYGGRYDGYYRDEDAAGPADEPADLTEDGTPEQARNGIDADGDVDIDAEVDLGDDTEDLIPYERDFVDEADVVEESDVEPGAAGEPTEVEVPVEVPAEKTARDQRRTRRRQGGKGRRRAPAGEQLAIDDETGDQTEVVESEPTVVEPEPEAEVVEPDVEVVEPDIEVVEPEAEVVEPEPEPEPEPEAEVAEPEAEVAEPEPEAEVAEPKAEVVEPEATEPEAAEPDATGFSKPPPGARPARKQRANGRSKSGSGRRR